ncbi:MAG: transposase, partial [Candidatus Thermoplasmatota archaeon]|nr:transposase [Candidatus Thermoplasmatota archaeon]
LQHTPKTTHFHYKFEPMLKLMVYQRLARIRYHSILEERLQHNVDKCAINLGFEKRVTPDRRTIGMFYFQYLQKEGHQNFFDSLVIRCKETCDKLGIQFGKRIGVDSTPLETLPSDAVGEYNAHYVQAKHLGKMVKVHVASCLDTGIPLAYLVTGANEYDGNILLPLLEKIRNLGIVFDEVYGDGHYDTQENWAKINLLYHALCYFNLRDGAIYNQNGSYQEIKRQYQKFHTCDDFVVSSDLSMDFMDTVNLRHLI